MTIRTVLIAGAAALMPLAAQAQWKERIEFDRITGELRFAAMVSPAVLAEEPRPFFFNAARGMLVVRCNQNVAFMFATASGLDGPTWQIEFGNLDKLPIRARVDDRVAEFQAYNRRKMDFSILVFSDTDNDSLYSEIVNAGKLLLEIPTVEYGDLYFSFSLAGTRDLHDRTCGTGQSD